MEPSLQPTPANGGPAAQHGGALAPTDPRASAAATSPSSSDHRSFAQARAELDEIRVAIDASTVTFHEVSRAWFGANHPEPFAPELRKEFLQAFRESLAAFSESRGGVESAYYCENIEVAAALTDIEEAANSRASVASEPGDRSARLRDRASASAIHVEPLLGQPENWQCKELLFDCLDLHYRALEFLPSQYRKICMRRIFTIITSLLGTLDARAKPSRRQEAKLTANELLCLRTELADTETYYRRHALRRAQVRYFIGMMAGVAIVAAIWLGAVFVGGADWQSLILIMLLAGGVGAVVSVMMRLTHGRLTLDCESGKVNTVLLGAFRPMTGAVFGALAYVLIGGGLLVIASPPAGATEELLYFASLGFAAGFSERIAQIVPDLPPLQTAGVTTPAGGRMTSGTIAQIAQQATDEAAPDRTGSHAEQHQPEPRGNGGIAQ